MSEMPLAHNPLNGVTAGVWLQVNVVHKVLMRRRATPVHWAASEDLRHWSYRKREAESAGLDCPGARYAARAAGFGLCAWWAQEAEELAHTLAM